MTFHEESVVPIIDFQPFLDGTPEGKLQTGKSLVHVMKTVGFMYIMNHGIPVNEQKRMFEWSKRFFQMDVSKKQKCPHPKDGANHRGWSSVGKEKVVQMVFDEKKIEALRSVPDVKESFDLGNPESGNYTNIWPDDADIPGFKEYCLYYHKICANVSENLLKAIALGMDLHEDLLISYHQTTDNQLRLLHYPPVEELSLKNGKAERIAPHTDFGTLTMLLQDDCGGLQVEDPNNPGVFVPAPPIPGSLVVNTGDFLMRWSNDQLKSTLHRVTAPPVDSKTGITKERFSIPYFVSADKDKVIEALPGTFSEDTPKRYEPIKAGEYLSRRLNATY